MSLGNWLWPSSLRQFFCDASTSLLSKLSEILFCTVDPHRWDNPNVCAASGPHRRWTAHGGPIGSAATPLSATQPPTSRGYTRVIRCPLSLGKVTLAVGR